MAAATMATIPVIAIYMFTQRWFVKGIVISGFGGR
jgi:multiple sugar transport system permease protein